MASDYYHSYHQDRLWPVSLEDRLVGLLARVLGCVMLVALAAVWLCLVTWSNEDPSLMHTTGGAPRNFFGFVGATISDLLIQTFGLAIVIALMAPMVWAFELAFSQRVSGFRNKATYFPLAVVIFAGALSSLPTLESWPLNHGFGGILGDTIYRLGANLCEAVLPGQGGALTGLILFAGGSAAAVSSTGLELFQLAQSSGQGPFKRSVSDFVAPWMNQSRPADSVFTQPAFQAPMFQQRTANSAFDRAREKRGRGSAASSFWGQPDAERRVSEHTTQHPAPVVSEFPMSAEPATKSVEGTSGYPPAMPAPEHSALPAEDQDFDVATDIASREIARRFAPVSAESAQGHHTKLPRAQSAFLTAFRSRDNRDAYNKPSLELLRRAPIMTSPAAQQPQVLRGQGRLLVDALAEFGVLGEVVDVKPGPLVTRYTFALDTKIKPSRVISLSDDIARSMGEAGIRVASASEAHSLYFEVPNAQRRAIHLRELIESSAFRSSTAALPLALGRLVDGTSFIPDLAQLRNVLVVGESRSSGALSHCGIVSLLYRFGPDRCQFLMIDSKAGNLRVYDDLPHLAGPPIRNPEDGVVLLKRVVDEMEERHKRMATLSARRIDIYNNRVHNGRKRGEIIARTVQTGFDKRTGQAIYERQAMDAEPIPHLVVVVDELSELMAAGGRDVEEAIERIGADGVAAGVHLFISTQAAPSRVMSARLSRAVSTKICFRVPTRQESQAVLGAAGGETLLPDVDALILSDHGQLSRAHSAAISGEELAEVVRSLGQGGGAQFNHRFSLQREHRAGRSGIPKEKEPSQSLYDRAVAISLRDGGVTPAYLQCSLSIDFDAASDLIARLQADNIVCSADKNGVCRTLPRSA